MGLNPCSNGRYSRSLCTIIIKQIKLWVLILVLMEDTLRVYKVGGHVLYEVS